MKDDEIIAEVRRVRAQIYKEAGGTLDGLYAYLLEFQKKHAMKLVSLPPRRRKPVTSKSR